MLCCMACHVPHPVIPSKHLMLLSDHLHLQNSRLTNLDSPLQPHPPKPSQTAHHVRGRHGHPSPPPQDAARPQSQAPARKPLHRHHVQRPRYAPLSSSSQKAQSWYRLLTQSPNSQHAGLLLATTPPDAPQSRTSSADAWTDRLLRPPPRTPSTTTCPECRNTSPARGSRNKAKLEIQYWEGMEALAMSLP